MLTVIFHFIARVFGFNVASANSERCEQPQAPKAVPKAKPKVVASTAKVARNPRQSAPKSRLVPKLSVLPTEHKPGGYGPLCQPIFAAFALLKKVRLNHEQLACFVGLLSHKSAEQFRLLVKRLLEAQGYRVELIENCQHDLLVQRDGHTARVHTCNNARSLTYVTQRAFGANALVSVQEHAQGTPLMVFTAGRVNEVAKTHAKTNRIMLVDGRGLLRLLAAYGVLNLTTNACKEVKHAA